MVSGHRGEQPLRAGNDCIHLGQDRLHRETPRRWMGVSLIDAGTRPVLNGYGAVPLPYGALSDSKVLEVGGRYRA